MKCAVQIYMVLGGFHVYKSVFLGWVVGRFNIAVNGEHNCGVLPTDMRPACCVVLLMLKTQPMAQMPDFMSWV